MKKSFLVIGAGRFGKSVAHILNEAGHDVMVVDKDEALIQDISSEVTEAITADATLESSIKAIGAMDFDAVVLAIGSDIQASIMAAILLIENEAKYIVAKAQTDLHGKVLEKIGVNRVVYPERDMGHKVARSLIAPTIIDMIEFSNDYSIVEVQATEEMVGKSLSKLDLLSHHEVNVIAIRSNSEQEAIILPLTDDIIKPGDVIVAIGKNKSLHKLGWF